MSSSLELNCTVNFGYVTNDCYKQRLVCSLEEGMCLMNERFRQRTSSWVMIQGREVRDNVSRVIVFMTRLKVVTFSIIYWRLVVSRVSDETGH